MKLSLRILAAASLAVAVSACTTAPKGASSDSREPADIRGANYFKGTYDCADQQNGLSSNFTFGAAIATFDLKGENVQLSCDSARSASPQMAALFRNEYKQFGDFCVGRSKKGQVVTGSSNSMGAVQMTAILIDQSGKPTAKALLNCQAAKAAPSNGWGANGDGDQTRKPANSDDVTCKFGKIEMKITQGSSLEEGSWTYFKMNSAGKEISRGQRGDEGPSLAREGDRLAFFVDGKIHVMEMKGKSSTLNIGLNSKPVKGNCCIPGYNNGEAVCDSYPQ